MLFMIQRIVFVAVRAVDCVVTGGGNCLWLLCGNLWGVILVSGRLTG